MKEEKRKIGIIQITAIARAATKTGGKNSIDYGIYFLS